MRVQEVILDGTKKRYLLLNSKGIPIISVAKYLKHIDNTGKSFNTKKHITMLLNYSFNIWKRLIKTIEKWKPCKDLGVGIFEGNIKKYEIPINSTKALIEQAKVFNREDMVNENEELLNLYEEIYNTTKNGNTVYGRLDRLKRRGDISEWIWPYKAFRRTPCWKKG